MRVRTAVSLAFRIAAARYTDIHDRWRTASIKVGGQLPKSILIISIQRCGETDMLLRSMEDEFNAKQDLQDSDIEFMAFHYQVMLSEYWIGALYEITRLRKERGLFLENGPEHAVARQLHILRMPIDKHEIANGPGLKHPLQMQCYPPNGDASDLYTYDRKNPNRAHIMPTGMSSRGSIMWQAIDGATLDAIWLERRDISDTLLDIWAPSTIGGEAVAI